MTDRLTPAELDAELDRLLAHEPRPRVVAIGPFGQFVPMPEPLHRRLAGCPQLEHGTTFLDVVVPADRPVVIETWERARVRGTATASVHPAIAPTTSFEMVFVDVQHSFGVTVGLVLGEKAFARVAPVQDDAPVLRPRYGVTHKDDLALLTYCDEAVLAMLGYRAEELQGTRNLELVHPDDHDRAIANWLDLLGHPGESRRVRLRHRRSDGSWLWLEITNTNRLADLGHVVGEAVDISDEMAAMEALRAGEELLRRLTDALPVGVVQLDRDGTVVYRNDQLETILQRPIPLGTRVLDGLGDGPAGQVLRPALERLLREGGDEDREVPVHGPDGVRRVEISLRALGAEDGSVSGVIACLDDVTEAARLREELAHRATFDALTGCLTRRALLEQLEGLLESGDTVTALFIDLDGFKPVNDRHGHAVGDALLRHVGACLREHVGDRGLVGRLGGDEFLVVVGAPVDDEAARAEALAVGEALQAPLRVGELELRARASIGIARSRRDEPADALVAEADASMYRVKSVRSR